MMHTKQSIDSKSARHEKKSDTGQKRQSGLAFSQTAQESSRDSHWILVNKFARRRLGYVTAAATRSSDQELAAQIKIQRHPKLNATTITEIRKIVRELSQ